MYKLTVIGRTKKTIIPGNSLFAYETSQKKLFSEKSPCSIQWYVKMETLQCSLCTLYV